MWLLIASVFGALSISALCSLMEAVLLSLRPSQVADLTVAKPKIGRIWTRLKSDIERPIAVILIINTTAHTVGASVAGAEFDRLFGDRWIWLFSLVFTFLMLQFTEILPKGVGVHYNQIAAAWLARPMAHLVRAMRPIEAAVRFLNRPFGPARSASQVATALGEIEALTGLARLSGEISGEHESILRGGARLSGTRVRDVMQPRVDIDALDVETPSDQILGAVAMSGFSRIPVYEDDLDHILGFVYIKDFLLEQHMGRALDLARLTRPALFVPESMRLDQLAEMFRREQTQMAIVLDEHGGTEGLVTLEDVLEEIVGTIHDEYRHEDDAITRRSETEWDASGSTNWSHLCDVLGRSDLRSEIPPSITTVGGLIQSQLGRVAHPGDGIRWHGLALDVVEVDGVRIARVHITKNEGPGKSPS